MIGVEDAGDDTTDLRGKRVVGGEDLVLELGVGGVAHDFGKLYSRRDRCVIWRAREGRRRGVDQHDLSAEASGHAPSLPSQA